MDTRTCNRCGRQLPLTEFHSDQSKPNGRMYRCRECDGIARAGRRAGRTLAQPGDYGRLYDAQGGRCAICGTDQPGGKDPRRGRFCIDHDHATGRVRGLLCLDCNRALGLFGDDAATVAKAAAYLHQQAGGNVPPLLSSPTEGRPCD